MRAMNVYRRHRRDCEADHAEDSTSGEFAETVRVHHFVSGTVAGRFHRKRTGATTWGRSARVTPPPSKRLAVGGVNPRPPCQHRTRPPLRPAHDLGCHRDLPHQSRERADRPRDASLKLGPRTKGLALASCVRSSASPSTGSGCWGRRLSSDIKPPIGSSKSADKMPFSDEELDRIRKACDNAHRPMHQRERSPGHVGCEYKNAQGSGAWAGEDVKDLIELMVHTGFHISDATLFDMSRLQGNNVMIRAQKNGHHVFAWLPERVRDRLTTRAKLHGSRPFIIGQSKRLQTVTNVWRRRLARSSKRLAPSAKADAAPLPPHVRATAPPGWKLHRRRGDGTRRRPKNGRASLQRLGA